MHWIETNGQICAFNCKRELQKKQSGKTSFPKSTAKNNDSAACGSPEPEALVTSAFTPRCLLPRKVSTTVQSEHLTQTSFLEQEANVSSYLQLCSLRHGPQLLGIFLLVCLSVFVVLGKCHTWQESTLPLSYTPNPTVLKNSFQKVFIRLLEIHRNYYI